MHFKDTKQLKRIADDIRLRSLELTVKKNKGHLGSTYSCVDMLVVLYYGGFLRVDSQDALCATRDRFILSKGHACLALYCILLDLGFISQEVFDSYGEDGGLGGQLDVKLPGVDWHTGSLGHSLGVCSGIALAAKLDNADYKAYTMLGDAECDEGSVWEGIVFAADHDLNNLICIVDRNRLSVTDVIEDNTLFHNFSEKMNSFRWNCYEIDGHSFEEIMNALKEAQSSDRPVMILANTVKGKGVSFMENEIKWHHSIPTKKELEIARQELNNK